MSYYNAGYPQYPQYPQGQGAYQPPPPLPVPQATPLQQNTLQITNAVMETIYNTQTNQAEQSITQRLAENQFNNILYNELMSKVMGYSEWLGLNGTPLQVMTGQQIPSFVKMWYGMQITRDMHLMRLIDQNQLNFYRQLTTNYNNLVNTVNTAMQNYYNQSNMITANQMPMVNPVMQQQAMINQQRTGPIANPYQTNQTYQPQHEWAMPKPQQQQVNTANPVATRVAADKYDWGNIAHATSNPAPIIPPPPPKEEPKTEVYKPSPQPRVVDSVDGLKFPYNYPIANPSKGNYNYTLDENNNVIKISFVGENNVNYKDHDLSKFFMPELSTDIGIIPDEQETIKALGKMKNKIQYEVLSKKMQDLHEGVETDFKPTTDQMIQLYQPVVGVYSGTAMPYADMLKENNEFDQLMKFGEFTPDDVVVNYNVVETSGIMVSDEVGKLSLKYADCKTFKDIANVMNEILDHDIVGTEELVRQQNRMITGFINRILNMVLNVQVTIDSFNLDIDDLSVMLEEKGMVNELDAYVKPICNSILNPVSESNRFVKAAVGEDVSNNNVFTTFIYVTNVTVLPIHSSKISFTGKLGRAYLTNRAGEQNPLYDAIHKLVTDASYDKLIYRFHICTKDNRVMEVLPTANDGYLLMESKI